jgi:hypothetical protein
MRLRVARVLALAKERLAVGILRAVFATTQGQAARGTGESVLLASAANLDRVVELDWAWGGSFAGRRATPFILHTNPAFFTISPSVCGSLHLHESDLTHDRSVTSGTWLSVMPD